MAASGQEHKAASTSGGDPLDEELAFKAFNPAFVGLLGRGSRLSAGEMQAFTGFALTLAYPPNPVRALDDAPTPEQAAGESVFTSLANTDGAGTCNACHALPLGTDGFSTVEGETQEFKIAHLRNLYQKVGTFGLIGPDGTGFLGPQVRGFGVLHDGSVANVFTFLDAGSFDFGADPVLAETRIRNVESFLLAFDTGLKPAVGQQVSLAGASASDPAVVARLDLLIARHEAGDCELVVHGVVAGEQRGALYVGGGLSLSDRASDAPVSTATLRPGSTKPRLVITAAFSDLPCWAPSARCPQSTDAPR